MEFSVGDIELREAQETDRVFLWQLKKAAMGAVIERVYGWDEALQREFFARGLEAEGLWIVQWQGHDVGMFVLHKEPDAWHLQRIELLPEFQGQGIGSSLLTALIEQARAEPATLRLQVFRENPRALRLYLRLGWRPIGETSTHIQLGLVPSEAGSCTSEGR